MSTSFPEFLHHKNSNISFLSFSMASSSSTSRNWKYHVFPSFRGEDVRDSFLSHLIREFERNLITTFNDHEINRSLPIGHELLLAIKESRIAIVIFSKNYASSTWCLNELVEIHKCWKESDQNHQMVIPIFYDVEPSHVRWQEGEFGNKFKETCEGETNDVVKQRWMEALTDVANLAGEDSKNWRGKGKGESKMIEHIAKDVFNKIKKPSSDLSNFVGIEAHLKRLDRILGWESEEVRILGIVGTPGIGKSTIGRALFSQNSSRFHHHAFVYYKSTTHRDDYSKKLCWDEQLLSEICQKDIKISHLGDVEKRLKHKKVLIIVDDLDDRLVLDTLVGQTRFLGSGSRIIVITPDRNLLKHNKIELIYEVEFPSYDLAFQMFCQSAFDQNSPPDGFMELAVEVVKLLGSLPLGLRVLGSSLKGLDMEKWYEMLPSLRESLNGDIKTALKVSYDRLDGKDQDLFLYIACLYNGHEVNYIKKWLGDIAKIGLGRLADKSLISITPSETVKMHSLLQKLGEEIHRAESNNNPGNRRFLTDAEEICEVLTDNTGTENVQAICFNTSEINEPLFIDEKSFQGMRNLKFLEFYKSWWTWWSEKIDEGRLCLPRDLVGFPRKLRVLHWDQYPSKCMPFNFRAEYLVELNMRESKLEKLWEGTQSIQNLKEMDMSFSENLKEIPDLSKAINLEKLILQECTSLVTLPSSIGNLNNLQTLNMGGCSNLKVLPANINLESLQILDLGGCSQLRTFPRISRNISRLYLDETALEGEEDCSWIENITHLTILHWDNLPFSCMPPNFCPEHLVELHLSGGRLEKLWGGVKSLESLEELYLLGCESLVEIPDLSKATNLRKLSMKGCTMLEVLPTDIDLESLMVLDLRGCSKLRKFPWISTKIMFLHLDDTAIEEVPSLITTYELTVSGCKKLKVISPIGSLYWRSPFFYLFEEPPNPFKFNNCFNLDRDSQKLIIESWEYDAVLPGGEVPMYFTPKACGSPLSVLLSERDLSEVRLKACIVVGPSTHPYERCVEIKVHWSFRGKADLIRKHIDLDPCERDHLVMFCFCLPIEKVKKSPSVLNNDVILLEFDYDSYAPCCFKSTGEYGREKSLLLPQEMKGYGVRVEYKDEYRSKKKMRMTVATSQQPSKSRNFHGDDGASPSLSISPSDSSLCGESLYFDPLIIDQQHTGTPQLVDYLSGWT